MYAGFWRRFLAYLIDGILLSIGYFAFIFLWAAFEILLTALKIPETAREFILGTLGIPLYFSLAWLYYAFFESSKFMGTLGKMALGITVVDYDYHKISFLRATARYWSKIISAIVLLIGFVMAGFTERKQALHDMIAGTYVVMKDFNNQHKTL